MCGQADWPASWHYRALSGYTDAMDLTHARLRLRGLLSLLIACAALLCPVGEAFGQSVDVTVDQFGVGNKYRPGGQVAMRIQLTSVLSEPADVWVQWEVSNVDGDIAEYGRRITLTPNIPQMLWLYAPLPPTLNSDVWPVRVFEYADGVRGREIGGARISPADAQAQMIDLHHAMLGIVGSSQRLLGLRDYSTTRAGQPEAAAANEITQLVSGISVEDLPDRWEGLMPCEALAWGDARPGELTLDQAKALREYVRRGGHLIITLSSTDDPWALGANTGQHEFEDLMPTRAPTRQEDVSLSELTAILSKEPEARVDFDLSVRVFADLDGDFNHIDNAYQPLIVLEDGRVLAIQRVFGHGHITIIGIDLTYQRLYSVLLANGASGLPQADAFWNRVLGRRADTPTATELAALEQEKLLSRARRPILTMGSGNLFAGRIRRSGQAGIGLSMTLLLFIAYWLIAGPGIYYGLRSKGLSHHSWVGFALAAAMFTAFAWGANLLKVDPVSIKHVTVLDHIYRPAGDPGLNDPQYQRAQSWFSVNLPGYTRTPVTIESTDDGASSQRDLLMSWTPPGILSQRFPNTSRYRVDVGRGAAAYDQFADANISEFALPSRSTATYMYAHWLGGVDAGWGGLIQPTTGSSVTVAQSPATAPSPLRGMLSHSLPGPLRDVKIIHINNNRLVRQYRGNSLAPSNSGGMLNSGRMWGITEWAPGETLDLASLGQQTSRRGTTLLAQNIFREYIQDYQRSLAGLGMTNNAISEENFRDYLEMLSFFHAMDPPKWVLLNDRDTDTETMALARELGRSLDLSVWFNRPCLIITGYIDNAECPIPVKVDGDLAEAAPGSLVMVRWIHPLPLDPVEAFNLDESRRGSSRLPATSDIDAASDDQQP